jgi:hypothetical protein
MRERAAIEALRAGVPNRAAIRELGTSESALHDDFNDRLEACRAGLGGGTQAKGLIVAGGFGAGKSHLLGHMREVALHEGFIVSLVPISKETPLFDLAKMYEATVRHAEVPSPGGDVVNDDLMTAIMSRLKPGTEAYDELERWATSRESGLAPLFAALLYLIPRQQVDPETLQEVARFLAGARLATGRLRQWLREAGAARLFDIKMPKVAELAAQRLRFAPRLFHAAGYAGWCVLLDETELIGRYSLLQRGRSYAELSRWLGLAPAAGVPGLVAVCALTDDFTAAVINDKRDDELVPARLEAKGLGEQARLAKVAMQALEQEQRRLRPPDEAKLRDCLASVSELYRKAYHWVPSEIDIGERLTGKTMRQYIKSWITAWDIERLYGERPGIETELPPVDYTENLEYERAPEGDDLADGGA